MKNLINEKLFGVALAASIAVSFANASSVQAETIFPPAHLDGNAGFVETGERSARPVTGPWYRTNVAYDLQVTQVPVLDRSKNFASANAMPGPWYRATK
jgi:hypothetical protein